MYSRPSVYRMYCDGGNRSEVTAREVLFCFVIAAALLSIGFWISSAVQHSVNRRLLQYRQAAQIENDDTAFRLAMDTDLGNAFVEGEFRAVDTVAHEKLPGRWLYIDAEHQRYTKHTRLVTYTVSDGKGRIRTRTRTETYWSWDSFKNERMHSKKVKFCHAVFPYGKFQYLRASDYKTVSTGLNLRICFTMMPTNFHAACYTRLADGTVSDRTPLFKDWTVPQLYENFTTSHAVLVFWILWGIFVAIVLVAFVLHENDWLDD